jgi:WD40 repeat protein
LSCGCQQAAALRLWEGTTETRRQSLSGASGVEAVDCSADGDTVATGLSDGTVIVWDASTLEQRFSFRASDKGILWLRLSRDGKGLLTRAADGTRLWDCSAGQGSIIWGEGEEGRPVLLALGRADPGRIVATSGESPQVSQLGTEGLRTALQTFAPESTLAALRLGREIALWDLATGRVLAVLKGHTVWVWTASFSPDGRTLASGDDSGAIKLWNVASGQEMLTLENYTSSVKSLAFSQDSRTLVSCGDGEIRLWPATGTR